MPSRPLWQHHNEHSDCCKDHPGRQRTAERQAAVARWLVQKVSDRRTERPRQINAAQNRSTREIVVQ